MYELCVLCVSVVKSFLSLPGCEHGGHVLGARPGAELALGDHPAVGRQGTFHPLHRSADILR
jgi:hypothetical protein